LDQARQVLPKKTETLEKALHRLHAKRRIHRVRKGFYVLVPMQYASTGIIPAEWFVADLMAYLGKPFYIGCLSAAERHGAAHQRPQELQVVVPVHLRIVHTPVLRIRFLRFAGMAAAVTQPLRTYSGDIPLSSPEWTAIDLIRFQKHYGSLDAAATVLTELAESLDANRLSTAARREPCNALLQRLGWMLDFLKFRSLTGPLHSEVSRRNAGLVALNSALKRRSGPRDTRWNVMVNEVPESDL
jgi:predicted transcriptional regulator of viral defense system